jgi:hypothetical protein
LTAQIEALNEKISQFREQVAFLMKKLFAKSSEKAEAQSLISLFEDSVFFSTRDN